MAELRSFIFIDQLQPQTMCYLGTWIKGRLPRLGMAAQIIEIAPGVEIRIMRRAVMNILPEDSPEDDAPAEPETDFGEKPADDWDSTDKNP